MLKIIIAGGRDFNRPKLIEEALLKATVGLTAEDVMIITGGARGADYLGDQLAKSHGTNRSIYPAQWTKHGKSAGYKRNELMAQNADMLLAFWNGNKTCSGTYHMIQIAKQKGLKLVVVDYEGNHYESDQY